MLDLIKRMIQDKKDYKEQMARVAALPEDYRFVFDKIQGYLWIHAAGDGHDMLKLQYELIDLFETSAAEGKQVLNVTGDDVVAFCDELLRDVKTWADGQRKKINRDIAKKFGKSGDSQ